MILLAQISTANVLFNILLNPNYLKIFLVVKKVNCAFDLAFLHTMILP